MAVLTYSDILVFDSVVNYLLLHNMKLLCYLLSGNKRTLLLALHEI